MSRGSMCVLTVLFTAGQIALGKALVRFGSCPDCHTPYEKILSDIERERATDTAASKRAR